MYKKEFDKFLKKYLEGLKLNGASENEILEVSRNIDRQVKFWKDSPFWDNEWE